MARIDYMYLLTGILFTILIIFLTMVISGNLPWEPNIYNSYAIQAQNWLRGRLDVENYSHLEIAVFGGRYFISFPPFPSIFLLPFVLIFGTNTPDHFINAFAAVLGFVYAFKLALRVTDDRVKALFYSLLLCVGSNLLFLSTTGYVWFMAQVFAFTLTLMAFYYAVGENKKPALSLFLFCAAMGCRPFNALFLPVLFYFLYDKNVKKLLISSIPAVALGIVFMALNYFRFGSIFEFGHNFLPEFTEAEHGQFSIVYLADNFRTLWRLPYFEAGRLRFFGWNGTAFWLVSPIVLVYALSFVVSCVKRKGGPQLVIPLLVMAHLLLTCTHKTMGGWHFGHRYTVDVLPMLFLGLVLQDKDNRFGVLILSVPLMVFGMIVNIWGTWWLYSGMP